MTVEFIRQGWIVSGCGRDSMAIQAWAKAHSSPHHFQVCDVRDDAQVSAFCRNTLERCGTPDLVLNNAAIIHANAPLWQISAEEFKKVMEVNIEGPANIMRHLLPSMLKRRRGVVVNFSSGWGRSTAPEVAGYCASKFAIEGLSQSVAQETEGKVAIVPLNPGIIDTDMLRSCFGDEASSFPKATAWAKSAVPFLINLSHADNGKSLSVP